MIDKLPNILVFQPKWEDFIVMEGFDVRVPGVIFLNDSFQF